MIHCVAYGLIFYTLTLVLSADRKAIFAAFAATSALRVSCIAFYAASFSLRYCYDCSLLADTHKVCESLTLCRCSVTGLWNLSFTS